MTYGAIHPGSYSTTDARFSTYSFERYVKTILSFPDGHFDLILVDGRSRASCLHEALPKIRRGGYVVLDNSERDEYQEAIGALPFTRRLDFDGIGPYIAYTWRTSAFLI